MRIQQQDVTLTEFASAHRLRTRRDEIGDLVVPGRFGQIYSYGGGRLACMIEHAGPATRASKARWSHWRRACSAAGMVMVQNGDDQGTFTFVAADEPQALLAIAAVRARRRRTPSPAQARVLAKHAFAAKGRDEQRLFNA